ncbi:hypothetical protein Tco_1120962 [Tanacetum coccineum]|uniref:Uncharacterized protein n=1 Tax=Tanacetum coccineum TaxID=301880 RepID=A0ABQ5IYK5_9ASTR
MEDAFLLGKEASKKAGLAAKVMPDAGSCLNHKGVVLDTNRVKAVGTSFVQQYDHVDTSVTREVMSTDLNAIDTMMRAQNTPISVTVPAPADYDT